VNLVIPTRERSDRIKAIRPDYQAAVNVITFEHFFEFHLDPRCKDGARLGSWNRFVTTQGEGQSDLSGRPLFMQETTGVYPELAEVLHLL
jgi:hypothetical protein